MVETIKQSMPSVEEMQELQLWRALRPYIGHCLALNHDINNPLAGILGYGEFLLSDPQHMDEDQIHQLRQIMKCAERIKKLADSLCEEKIALAEKIDLRSVSEAYKKTALPSD